MQIYPDDDEQHVLTDQMMSYWANFARNGSPGKGRGTRKILNGSAGEDPTNSAFCLTRYQIKVFE